MRFKAHWSMKEALQHAHAAGVPVYACTASLNHPVAGRIVEVGEEFVVLDVDPIKTDVPLIGGMLAKLPSARPRNVFLRTSEIALLSCETDA